MGDPSSLSPQQNVLIVVHILAIALLLVLVIYPVSFSKELSEREYLRTLLRGRQAFL